MFQLFIALLSAVFLFLLGYYLGHQMGRTEHIRKRLTRDRRERDRQADSSHQVDSKTT